MVWYSTVVYLIKLIEHYMAVHRYAMSLLMLKKKFHEWAQQTSEIFFNTWREILYLHEAM